jgi:integrase
MPNAKESATGFVKVAECLYRYQSSGTYFALIKRKGKQIRKSLKTQDRKLANRRLKELREKAGLLTATSQERKLPFEVIATRWLESHKGNLKPSAEARIGRNIKELRKCFEGVPISEITQRDCEEWAKKRGAHIAASTFNKDAEVLKSIFKYGIESGYLLDNPAKAIKRRRVANKEILIPKRDEFASLLEGIASEGSRGRNALLLVKLLAYSGMRLGEATRMIWREVDFRGNRFTVTGGDVGTKNKEPRIVPLFPQLKAFLKELHAERKPNPTDRIIPIDSAKTAIQSACRAKGLPHFTHHSLRHYFVSNAIEKGIDFKTIAAWVGHKDGGLLVAKTYGHLRDTHSMEMAKLMTE